VTPVAILLGRTATGRAEPVDEEYHQHCGSFRRGDRDVKRWECQICGFIYDEAEGLPEEGITPGTRWGDIPDDWACPDCGTAKSEFEMIELVA